jgi:hypothetical protein
MLGRSTVRNGRALLLWGLLSFSVLQIGLGLVIDEWLPGVRDAEFVRRYGELRARMAEQPDAPIVLGLGSSRLQLALHASRPGLSCGGKPALVYNFGLSGAGPLMQLVALRRLLADGVRPAALLVEITPAFYNQLPGRLMEEKFLDGTRLSVTELGEVRPLCKVPRMLWGKWLLGRCLPCYRHAADLRHFGETNASEDGHGWMAPFHQITAEVRRERTAFALGQYDVGCRSSEIAPQPMQALRMLLDLCRENEIAVHLVVLPEGSEFRALYHPASLAALDRSLVDCCREYHISLTNAREWLEDEMFWDGHHQLPAGADKFTARLAGELGSVEKIRGLPAPKLVGLRHVQAM